MMSVTERKSMIDPTSELSMSKQCKLLSIHRSGVYYKAALEKEENLTIMRFLDEQYYKTPFYGCRKLTALLQRHGYKINRKRTTRLMKLVNWHTIYRAPNTSLPNKEHAVYPYLLKSLAITHTNQVWAMDITYVPMAKGFMYLTAIIDLYSRKVMNWSISNHMSADWCAMVVQEAILLHGKPNIFNTDQGSQFTSQVFTHMLKENEIQISMDGKGRAIDNIYIERLWRSVKYENIYLNIYENGIDLYQGLKMYFDFYNNDRIHQNLDYKTPNEKNKMAA